MYDQNFRNQAVKECVNGQTLNGTARKYGISTTALRAWIKDYNNRMKAISVRDNSVIGEKVEGDTIIKKPAVQLTSVNINIDGYDVTISKKDAEKLMEMFHRFDE